MNLIIVQPDEVRDRGEIILTDHRAEHIRTVLKGREGQSLRVGQLNGSAGTGMIKSVTKEQVVMRAVFDGSIPPVPPVDLLLALPRPKVMKRLWAPLASLGVGRILLTNAQKVERCYFDSHILEPAFYNERLQEGLSQAMDTRMPHVSVHLKLKALLEDELDAVVDHAVRVVADPAGAQRFSAVAPEWTGKRVLLAVGPEGGWSDYELDLLKQHRFTPVTIGPRTLRTDTACVALLAMVHEALAG